jgi:signal transduction histidine kinase
MLKFSSQLISSSIGRRLMVSIVLFSSVITLLTTGYQLFNDYKDDIHRIDRTFSSVEKVNLDVLAASIWVIDERLINTQLDGLIQLPDIIYIDVKDDSGQAWSTGAFRGTGVIEKQFQLTYHSGTEDITVGTLKIQADLNAIYARLYDRAIVILLANGIKTFLVAGFILFLVWINVTRPLEKLSDYSQNIDLDGIYEPLSFNNKGRQDEFDQVAIAINTMQQQLRASFDAIKQSRTELQVALEDRERLLELERSYKEELARQVKEQTHELEQSLIVLKRAQQVLVEQEKMAALGGLVSGVAHEINTPIGICLTAASAQLAHVEELIKLIHSENATLDEINAILTEYQQSCELIVSNITRASNLIQKFKTIAAEQSHEEHSTFNLRQQVQDVADATELIFSPTKANVEIDIDPSIHITTNYSLLKQIITNIISNAYTHAFKGSTDNKLHISAGLKKQYLTINIEDNGKGIPKDVADHMFEPFFTTNRSQGGTGLGLSAAFNAATLLKGSVSYRPESDLGGAKFCLRFPVKQHLFDDVDLYQES